MLYFTESSLDQLVEMSITILLVKEVEVKEVKKAAPKKEEVKETNADLTKLTVAELKLTRSDNLNLLIYAFLILNSRAGLAVGMNKS